MQNEHGLEPGVVCCGRVDGVGNVEVGGRWRDGGAPEVAVETHLFVLYCTNRTHARTGHRKKERVKERRENTQHRSYIYRNGDESKGRTSKQETNKIETKISERTIVSVEGKKKKDTTARIDRIEWTIEWTIE